MGGFNVETKDPPVTSDQLAAKLDEDLVLPEGATAEEEDQLKAGKAAAVAVAQSGCLGATGAEGDFYGAALATVSNPGHAEPEEGPNDRVTVEVRKVAEEWPPARPEGEEAEVAEEEPAEERELATA